MIYDHDKLIKIFYLDESLSWIEYSEAKLLLQASDSGHNLLVKYCNSQLKLTANPPAQKLHVIPLKQYYRQVDKTIFFGIEMISQLQRAQNEIIFLKIDEWNRILSFSFKNIDYCEIIIEELQLKLESLNQLPCHEQGLIKYLADQMQNSTDLVQIAFQSDKKIRQFIKEARLKISDPNSKKDLFKICKLIFMRGQKKMIEHFIKDEFFPTLLSCLSFNYEFGDRQIDYAKQFENMVLYENIIQLTDEELLEAYSTIKKLRYLKDVVISMFIQINTQSTINEIISQKNYIILSKFANSSQFFIELKSLQKINHKGYINIFSEIWENFKLVIEDVNTIQMKKKIYLEFISSDLLECTIQSLCYLARQNNCDQKIYQKSLQALNPLLTFSWNFSQDLLLEIYKNKKIHLLQALLDILKIASYHTKIIVLTFAKHLVEITELRKSVKIRFSSYVFNQFLSKCMIYFEKPAEIEAFSQYIIKFYQIDEIRTRRVLVQTNYLKLITSKIQNRYIMMAALKILNAFLEGKDTQIFGYLERNLFYSFLLDKYIETKQRNAHGLFYSLFLCLIKSAQKTENKFAKSFIFRLIFPNDKL